MDALEAAEAAIPLYLRKRRLLQSSSKSSSFSSLTQLFFGAPNQASSSNGGSSNVDGSRPKLQALVLTKNREIAASVSVRGLSLSQACRGWGGLVFWFVYYF